MMTTNQEFKNVALSALKGNWAQAVLATLVMGVVAVVSSGTSSVYSVFYPDPNPAFWSLSSSNLLFTILVFLPLSVGFVNAFKVLYLYSTPNILLNSFSIGFGSYFRVIGGSLLVSIFTCLWTLLLIVPGFIKAYSYSMTSYILIDDPNLTVREAVRKSQRMMAGHKFDLFWLQLSFIGWGILSILTMGIGFLWLIPYYTTAQAAFYRNLRDNFADPAF